MNLSPKQRLRSRSKLMIQFSSVQSLSRVQLYDPMKCSKACLSITNSRSSLKLTSIESVMPSSHLILCRPLLLLPPIPPSIRVFSNASTLCMRWPKYWSFSLSIIPSKEHSGPTSFRMEWLALLAVQGTLKSLLQHHSSKASILRRRRTFVGKVMSLLLNMLSRLYTRSLIFSMPFSYFITVNSWIP